MKNNNEQSQTDIKVILPGEEAGNYSKKWYKTFDIVFLIGWLCAFLVLYVLSINFEPGFLTDYQFLLFCSFKLFIMLLVSLLGGIVCRHYCKTDDKGYIITNPNSWFKVNYTRKIQHFAAYLIPLISASNHVGTQLHPQGIIPHLWESLFVLLMFLLLIKPIREKYRFFMLQFNSLDRPEDRPNTLKWIVIGNILPGLILGTIFKQFFEHINEPNLVLIIVFIVGIGDGLAEPVGIYWGHKKYLAPSWFMKKRYIRSYAGSACVLLSAIVFILIFYSDFNHPTQFVVALILIPPIMTLLEATAPHSMDTPIMMLVGFSVLYAICLFN
ncbi:MAG: hypothetical protein M0Q38_13120 [Bacteroidales bacterium]|jgi:dolichol kinase|nr:hypothetical protein [Bacteroidales bacterium]